MKTTFDFNITSPFPVVASGLPVRESNAKGDNLYKFKQNVPIPSYLFAVASGCVFPSLRALIQWLTLTSRDLTEAPVGPRSVVVSSPDKIDDCQWELEAHTEKFIEAIEVGQIHLEFGIWSNPPQKIVYPYAWGEYNILILPPSFPYGGMENPIYTFATPSLISKVLLYRIQG